jgi:hypothetical protein
MFDKEYMMEDEYGFYLRQMAREMPMNIDRTDRLVSFISDYINTRNRIIKKYEAEGKDATNLVADRDYALYVLGLGEKPTKQAKVIL